MCPSFNRPWSESPHLELLDSKVPLARLLHVPHQLPVQPVRRLIQKHLQLEDFPQLGQNLTQNLISVSLGETGDKARQLNPAKFRLHTQFVFPTVMKPTDPLRASKHITMRSCGEGEEVVSSPPPLPFTVHCLDKSVYYYYYYYHYYYPGTCPRCDCVVFLLRSQR